MSESEPLIIKHTPQKVVGWLCVAFFTFGGVSAWLAGQRSASLLFLVFVALGGFILLNSGSMHVDYDSITSYLPFRSYQIKWNEVRYIEIDRQGGSMVFVGEDKKLAVNGPALWAGKDKRDAANLIAAQMDRYGIEFRLTEKAMLRLSRNTKVRT
jgi:hypothetical protein